MNSPVDLEPIDLVAATSGRRALADTGLAPKRLGASLAALLERSGLDPGPIDIAPSTGEWPAADCGHMLFACRNGAGRDCALILLAAPLFDRLFVHVYGGDRSDPTGIAPGAAQLRYARRLGDRLTAWLETAWADTAKPGLVGAEAVFDADDRRERIARFDAALMLEGEIPLADGGAHWVHVAISAEAMTASSRPADSRLRPSGALNGHQQLLSRVGDVHLPVRAALMLPDMSAARLAALQPGDVLPIATTRAVPLLVAGLPYATAGIGEWQGHAAMRIETLAAGRPA